jgi:Zn-dependent protease with chaperone function
MKASLLQLRVAKSAPCPRGWFSHVRTSPISTPSLGASHPFFLLLLLFFSFLSISLSLSLSLSLYIYIYIFSFYLFTIMIYMGHSFKLYSPHNRYCIKSKSKLLLSRLTYMVRNIESVERIWSNGWD